MKKGFYIVDYDVTDQKVKVSGIGKKIISQKDVLSKHFDVDFYSCFIDSNTLIDKLFRRVWYGPSGVKWNYNKILQNGDFFYIRRPLIDGYFIQLLKEIKNRNSKVKILLEIPTYPYDKEFDRVFDLPLLWKEQFFRKKLKLYVDRIVTLSEDNNIFGIPTLKIVNGLDLTNISIVNNNKKEKEVINLIGVGALKFWHGFDRLIRGMAHYYEKERKRKVIFYIVGSGELIGEYKQLIKKYGIEEYVQICGEKYGKELDKIYDIADFGISSLGLHRINIEISSALKSREYLAKGLPIIASSKIDVISKEFQYCLYFEDNDAPINVEKIVECYDELYSHDRQQINQQIRSYAEEHCSMDIAMKSVIDYLKNDNR